jgi:lactoylglutathione lyase
MKRFHVHLHVTDLAKNIAFYSTLFNQAPARTEGDYAKWMLQDPPVNFAISTRGQQPGLDHLGIQVESAEELQTLKAQAAQADLTLLDEGEATCCYARSEKYWVTDPQGTPWEQFHTLDNIPVFSETQPRPGSACCAPEAASAQASASCCAPNAPASTAAASSCCTPNAPAAVAAATSACCGPSTASSSRCC